MVWLYCYNLYRETYLYVANIAFLRYPALGQKVQKQQINILCVEWKVAKAKSAAAGDDQNAFLTVK